MVRATLLTLAGDEATATVFPNYFIPNSYESLHNKVQIVTAGCMVCSMCRNKTFKRWFSTLIHIRVKMILCYVFEGHINVGWGPHLALGPPVGQPYSRSFNLHPKPNLLLGKLNNLNKKGFFITAPCRMLLVI